jgi:hypothetical protein
LLRKSKRTHQPYMFFFAKTSHIYMFVYEQPKCSDVLSSLLLLWIRNNGFSSSCLLTGYKNGKV